MLIAGKGHETGQYIMGEVLPFSDREEAIAAIADSEKWGSPMAEVLWTAEELAGATGVDAERAVGAAITGVSIDSRTLQPGDLFVAIRGDSQDGHAYVDRALAAGAAAAIVEAGLRRQPRPADPRRRSAGSDAGARPRGAGALRRQGSSPSPAASARPARRKCCGCALAACGPTHASEKSYNNHWGVPLTLARLPRSAQFGVFEIGMNHAGEITPLTEDGAPAHRHHHHGRAGAHRVFQLGGGDRRRQGGNF